VVGLNTSAMIEAGIVGKPVHSILAEEFGGGQEQTLHFHYLRAQNGGLLHEARTLEENAGQLARAFRNDRADYGQNRAFIERFIRPRGMDTPVAPMMVEEIERAARLAKRPQRWTPVWQRAAGLALQAVFNSRRAITGTPAPRRSDA
jgi:hypothetical protein